MRQAQDTVKINARFPRATYARLQALVAGDYQHLSLNGLIVEAAIRFADTAERGGDGSREAAQLGADLCRARK